MLDKSAPITQDSIRAMAKEVAANPHHQAISNALTKNEIGKIAFRHSSLSATPYKFSIDIKTLPVTNQEASGRCWLFAGMNVLREIIAKKYNLEAFELSQNYMAFYDKFEKINYFLESAIELIDRPADDRYMHWLLGTGIQDGGQWDMIVNLVKKYGVIPKDAMPETYQSGHTGQMNKLINQKLRGYVAHMQRLFADSADRDALRREKEGMIGEMYAFLCVNFGAPPEEFDFEYVDKDKKYGVVRNLTPMSFYEQYIGDTLDDYISIINSPTQDKPFYDTYTVDYIGNVIGGREILYLNLPMQELIDLTLLQLKAGEVVWFGSDVGFYADRESGVWNDMAYDYDTAFLMDFSMTKDEMLTYRHSAMNHAMVITGVHLNEQDAPVRWKIQNSWGDKTGEKGYYLMSDTWFDKFVYQAVIHKKHLSPEQKEALTKTPKRLNPWDPMGTLAD